MRSMNETNPNHHMMHPFRAVKRAVALLTASALALGGSLLTATAAGAYEMDLAAVADHVTYDASKRVPAVESMAGIQGIGVGGAQQVTLPGTAGADSALVRISVFEPTQDVTVFAAGVPTLFAAAGQDASTTTLVAVKDGKAAMSASVAVDTRVEVLATFSGNPNAPGSTNPVEQPSVRPVSSVRQGFVGVLGLGGVPSEQVRAVYVTADVTLESAGVLTLAGQQMNLPRGRSVISTIAVPDAQSGALAVDANVDGTIALSVRGWVADAPANATNVNVTGSFVPTVGTAWSDAKASVGKDAQVAVSGLTDRVMSIALVSATQTAAEKSRSYVEIGRHINGRSQGVLVDDQTGALPQIEVVESASDSAAVSVRGADVDVRVLAIGDILGAPVRSEGKTDVQITSPKNGDEAELTQIGVVTLTGTVASDAAIDQIAVFGNDTEIGRADVTYTTNGPVWEMEVAAPESGNVKYSVKAIARDDTNSDASVAVNVKLPSEEDVVVNPDVTVIGPDDAASKVLAVHENDVVFESEPAFEIGAVIVSDVGENAPEGFMRRVTAIEKTEAGWVVSTSPAVLTEVFMQATIDDSPSLGDEHMELVTPTESSNDNVEFVGAGAAEIIRANADRDSKNADKPQLESEALMDTSVDEPQTQAKTAAYAGTVPTPRSVAANRGGRANVYRTNGGGSFGGRGDEVDEEDSDEENYALKLSCELSIYNAEDGEFTGAGDVVDKANKRVKLCTEDDDDEEETRESGVKIEFESTLENFGPTFYLDIKTDWKWIVPNPTLRGGRIDVHGDIETEAAVTAFAEDKLEEEVLLHTLRHAVTFPVGPVPVVIDISVPINLKAELSLEASLKYKYSANDHFAFGTEFKNGNWVPVKTFGPKDADDNGNSDEGLCGFASHVEGEFAFEPMIGLNFEPKVTLYGVAGPKMSLDFLTGIVTGKVTYNVAEGGKFRLKAGFKVEGELKLVLKIPVIDWEVAEFSVAHFEKKIAVGDPIEIKLNGLCPTDDDDNDPDKPNREERYNLSGVVTDAENGSVITDAEVEFTADDGHGSSTMRMTNGDGEFSIRLKAGKYVVKVRKNGYVNYANTVTLDKDVKLPIPLTKPLRSETEYRAVLTWGETPRDEDSHLIGTDGTSEPFHVYYADPSAYRGNDGDDDRIAWLDVDDTTSYGPETVTFSVSSSGIYSYYVHNYSAEAPLNTSGAQVVLYRGNEMIKTYSIPSDWSNQNAWTVFSIVNGQVTDYVDQSGVADDPSSRTRNNDSPKRLFRKDISQEDMEWLW